MNKITVIQLLNKIANGEEPPKRIFYKKQWWEYNPYNDYEGIEWGGCLLNNVCINELNSEITAYVEEDKEIEKITKRTNKVLKRELIYKLNELTEAVNELKKGK